MNAPEFQARGRLLVPDSDLVEFVIIRDGREVVRDLAARDQLNAAVRRAIDILKDSHHATTHEAA